jgi:hypothetical protein
VNINATALAVSHKKKWRFRLQQRTPTPVSLPGLTTIKSSHHSPRAALPRMDRAILAMETHLNLIAGFCLWPPIWYTELSN